MFCSGNRYALVAGWMAAILLCAAGANGQISNGDFEGGFTNGVANGWTLFSTDGYNPSGSDETGNVHGGSHAQKVNLPQPASGEGYGGISQVIDTVAGQLYRIDFWIYAHMPGESYQGQDLQTFMGFDAQGRPFDHSLTDFDISWIGLSEGRDEWRSIGREFLAAGDTATIFFKGWRKWAQHGGGYIIIDDVTIETVDVEHPPSVGETPPPEAPDLTGSNLLANPDFENGFTSGVANNWQSWTKRGSGTFTASSDRGKIGGGNYNPDGGAAMISLSETAKVALAMPPCEGGLTLIKEDNPEILTVCRLFIDETNFWDQDDAGTRALGRDHADNCYDKHLDHAGIDCWQGSNEPWVQSRERARKTGLFEQAFAERCTELGIRSCVINVGVGNPTIQEAEFFKDAIAVADFVGYHAYGGSSDQFQLGPQQDDFALRWRSIKSHYEDLGWRHPAVVYTEAGTYFGWKSLEGVTATMVRDEYIEFGPYMQDDEWCVGETIFTVGGYGIWDDWDIADHPVIIDGIRPWNQDHSADARGGKSQEWYHDGSNLRSGITQAVGTSSGDYWLSGWFKYETGNGGDPVDPDITFRIGYDPTGQTGNGDAGTIVWSSDQVASRHLNAYIWYEFGVSITATGSQTSIWFALDQATTSPTGRVYVDALDLRAAEGTPPPSPTISLSPTSLTPETDEGSSPSADSFTVQNTGTGTLDYSIADDENWLSVNPDSGTSTGEADTITVNYSTASLDPGEYEATITVTDSGASNSPQTVAVTLTVNAGGCENGDLDNGGFQDGLSPWVTFGTTDGIVNSGTFNVTAHGGSKMFGAACQWCKKNGGAYQQISVCNGADCEVTTWIYTKQSGGANWDVNCRIGIDPTGGTDSGSGNIVWTDWTNSANQWSQIGLTGNDSVTAQGETATVFIEHWHKWNLSLNLTMFDDVDFTATGGSGGGSPTIELSPTSLSPETDEGSSPSADSFTVKNVGAGTLEYSITDDVNWLSVNPDNGTSTGEADTITVNYSTASLDPGEYEATITVTDPDATNSPQMVGVTLTVNEVKTTVAEDFESMPSWSSSYDAGWGSAATWSIVGGGQSGNALQVSRGSQGSSAKVKVYTIDASTDYTLTIYFRCPSYGGSYWAECAYKLGNNSANNFDDSPGTWTMIKKFENGGTNGNGNQWVQYSKNFNSGANTQVSVGYKLGSSGGGGPTIGWDTLRIE